MLPQPPAASRQPPAAAAAALPAGTAVIHFSLVPADTPGILDYTTCQGIEIFNSASQSLCADPTDNYDVEAAGLQTFLALL